MRCVRVTPTFGDDWEGLKASGADLLELPLDAHRHIQPGKLWLLASRSGLPALATLDGESTGAGAVKLLEAAIHARFDHVELSLDLDVEARARLAALARKSGVKVMVFHRMGRPPASTDEILRAFQKCARAGADGAKVSLTLSKAREVRMALDALRLSSGSGVPHFIEAQGRLAPLASLLPADIVCGGLAGQEELLDIRILSKVGPRTRRFALLGEPPHHSLSLELLNGGFAAMGSDSVCIPLRPEPSDMGECVRLLREMGFEGFCVGRPFRERIMKHLEPWSHGIEGSGAASAAVMRKGEYRGFDTDGPALLLALEALGIRLGRRKALVLGSGGAARAVARALASRGAEVLIASRSLKKALAAASAIGCRASPIENVSRLLKKVNLLVSCVPATSSIPLSTLLRQEMVVVELACEPGDTALLKAAHEAGAMAVPGTSVMLHQSAEALRLFTGLRPPLAALERIIGGR